jgi:TPR repeat protein
MKGTKKVLLTCFLFCNVDAVAQNSQDAYEAANAALKRGHYATAMRGWQSLAAENNAGAKANLGYMYENGLGVKIDSDAAMQWYSAAIEGGSAEAAHNLAMMYRRNYSPENASKIVELFQKAADDGLDEARYMLAVLKYEGSGIDTDKPGAFSIFKNLAVNGHAGAQYMAAHMVFEGMYAPRNDMAGYVLALLSSAASMVEAAELVVLGRNRLGVREQETAENFFSECQERKSARCSKVLSDLLG